MFESDKRVREEILRNIAGPNLLMSSSEHIDECMLEYGIMPYGLPYKHLTNSKDATGMLGYLASALAYNESHPGKKPPSHFTIFPTTQMLNKHERQIREVIQSSSDWARSVTSKSKGIEVTGEDVKSLFSGDGLSIEKLKQVADNTVSRGIDDYSTIELLGMPSCRRVLFDLVLNNHELYDFSIEYKILNRYLKTYCDTTLDKVLHEIKTLVATMHDQDHPLVNYTDLLHEADKQVFAADFDFTMAYGALLYDVTPELVTISAYIHNLIVDSFPTVPRTFDGQNDIFEALFAVSTLSGSCLPLKHFLYDVRVSKVCEDKEYLSNLLYIFDLLSATLLEAEDDYKGKEGALAIEKVRAGTVISEHIPVDASNKAVKAFQKGQVRPDVLKNIKDSINMLIVHVRGECRMGAGGPVTSSTGAIRTCGIFTGILSSVNGLGAIAKCFTDEDGEESLYSDKIAILPSVCDQSRRLNNFHNLYVKQLLKSDLVSYLVLGIIELRLRLTGKKGEESLVRYVRDDKDGVVGELLTDLAFKIPNLALIYDSYEHGVDLFGVISEIKLAVGSFLLKGSELADSQGAANSVFEQMAELQKADTFDVDKFQELSAKLIEAKQNTTNSGAQFNELCTELFAALDVIILPLTQPQPASLTAEEAEKIKQDLIEANEGLRHGLEANEQLEAKVQELGAQIQQARSKAQMIEAACNRMGTAELPEAVAQYLKTGQIESLQQALEVADHTLGDKLVLLPSVYASASESEYQQPDRVLRELAKLVTEFLPVYSLSGTDDARKVFSTNVFRRGESDMVMQSEKMMTERMFEYQGVKQPFTMHLALGNSQSRTKHCRIYFKVEADHIVVAYCGKHLTSSRSS